MDVHNLNIFEGLILLEPNALWSQLANASSMCIIYHIESIFHDGEP